MKRLCGIVVVAVMLLQSAVGWGAAIGSGDMADPAHWGGTMPTPTTQCYVGNATDTQQQSVYLSAGNAVTLV